MKKSIHPNMYTIGKISLVATMALSSVCNTPLSVFAQEASPVQKIALDGTEITSITLREHDRSLAYLAVGETMQLQVQDQSGNPIDASLLEFRVNSSKGYIQVNAEGVVTAIQEGAIMNDMTQIEVALREQETVYTYINVVVPKAPVIDKVDVSTGSNSSALDQYEEGAISDTASKIYYFQLFGNAEWRSDLDTDNRLGTNGLPTITWYLDGTEVTQQKFNWNNSNNHSAGIQNPGKQAITISTYGQHEVKAVLEGLDGQTIEKVMQVERTPLWLNTDGSIRKITANAGDVVIPDTVNGYPMTTISSKDTEGVQAGVTSVVFPEGITSISDNFFQNASDLTSIEFKGAVPSGNLDFSQTKIAEGGIIVPDAYKDAYLAASQNWIAPEGKTWEEIIGHSAVDKTELQAFYDQVKDVTFAYTDTAYRQYFDDQLKKAEEIIASDTATQAEVDGVYYDLQQRYWLNMVNDKVAYYNPNKQGQDGRFVYSDKLTESILPLIAAYKDGRNDTSIYTDIEKMKTHYNAFLEAEKAIEEAAEDVRGVEVGFNVEADNLNNTGKFEITKQTFVEVNGEVKVKLSVTFINDGIDHVTGKEGDKYSLLDLKDASYNVDYQSPQGNGSTFLKNVQPLDGSYYNGVTGEVEVYLDSVVNLSVKETYMPGYVKVIKYVEVDKTQLETQLGFAKNAIDTAYNYTQNANWDTFVETYTRAQEVYEDLSATQDEVDAVHTELVMAYLFIRYETVAPTASLVIDGETSELEQMHVHQEFDLKLQDNGKLYQFILNGQEFMIDGQEEIVSFDAIKDILNQGNGEAGKNVLIVRDSVPPVGSTYLNESTYTFYYDTIVPQLEVHHTITKPTKEDVVVTITANEMLDVNRLPEGWSVKAADMLATEGMTIQKTYRANTAELITVYDLAGNPAQIDIVVDNIDKEAPVIHADDVVLSVGDTFDPLAGVSVSDNASEGLVPEIIYDDVDLTKAGTYTITYSVSDAAGNVTVFSIKVRVNPKMVVINEAPVITAIDKVLVVGDRYNVMDWVVASDKEDGDLTNLVTVIENTVDTSKAGTYKVVYQVVDSANAKVTKTITVTVKEKATEVEEETTETTKPSETLQTPATGMVSPFASLAGMMTASLIAMGTMLKRRKNEE